MRLRDKVCIVTGAGRGIGKEIALRFASEGAKVAVCEIDEMTGAATASEIQEKGHEAIFVKVDVTNRESVKAMVEETTSHYGRIDVLVNNAGITADALLVKMTEEQWDKVIGVNLKGVFNCTQAVAPKMIEQGKGKIINISSVVGLYGNFGQTNYAATKSGVIGMTKTWGKELGRKGINVNAVAPGFIITEMTAKMPQKVLDMMKDKTPLGRLGTPQDVASAVLFLASDESDYVNGAVLSVDGGIVL
ncbi:MAG TPA: 3-oxoacyl-[acyl-carrier-protein] reductase [Firmicutes bacterium]|nr:3-oxoacyl-[acyl-carrier-protein] reductase [Bacillota bacterium]